ncbi:MAG: hypothetical protein U5N23_19825 [Acidovorax sp.]|nr:hypothetical protein [Acidovorax sp.]MDZ7865016.1 hypothetical protein [Acidovorax sp.]
MTSPTPLRARTGQAPEPLDRAARLDRYIGYYESYAQSHEVLDRDAAMQAEIRGAAQALAVAVGELRAGTLSRPDAGVRRARPR